MLTSDTAIERENAFCRLLTPGAKSEQLKGITELELMTFLIFAFFRIVLIKSVHLLPKESRIFEDVSIFKRSNNFFPLYRNGRMLSRGKDNF